MIVILNLQFVPILINYPIFILHKTNYGD